jgi:hypothetical protein
MAAYPERLAGQPGDRHPQAVAIVVDQHADQCPRDLSRRRPLGQDDRPGPCPQLLFYRRR